MTDTKKKLILLVFGTRPEAIKMAPLVKEFQKHLEQFETKVCVTAQHRQMLDQVLQLFEITPDYDLNIMKAGQDLYDVTSRVLLGMRDVLKVAKPDIVLVHGDTSTSTAAALAAFYQQIPVGHVEAGLRTRNIYSPWPEEMNRQITSRIATFHFVPTQLNKQNLLAEGVKERNIYVTGNTVIDALHWVIDKIKNTPDIREQVLNCLNVEGISENSCNSWVNNERKLVLITGHRRENFGQGFVNICEAIKELAEKYPGVDFVYPMHLNPNVRNAIKEVFGINAFAGNNVGVTKQSINGKTNTYFIEPLDYLPFVYLMNLSYLVLTDSGGIQEEAPSLGKPVLVMRDTTERPEAVNAGTAMIVGTYYEKIVMNVSELLNNTSLYKKMAEAHNPYGDGKASQRIVNSLS
jgi:UDP-N-acetylglucosamine 2-epimerase (non-hydrolysing)